MFSGQFGFASSTQVLDPREILDLQVRRGSCKAVSICFDFVLGKITGWPIWMGKELSNGKFVSCLERPEILKSMAIFRNLKCFKDTKGLKHLVHHWCPFLHTFFFLVGELTITLEDVVNNFLLPVFGDENPFDMAFPARILKLKTNFSVTLADVPLLLRGKPARIGKWVMNLSREKDKAVR